MFTRISTSELDWLKDWKFARHAGYVPPGYARQVVVLHPGARVDRNAQGRPVDGPSSQEGEPSRSQIEVLGRALLGHSDPSTPAYAALYDGYPGSLWSAPVREVAVAFEINVLYQVVGGTLEQLVRHDWDEEHLFVPWVSMLWPHDRGWFLTSDPDSPFTVIACPDDLAETLLAESEASAIELEDHCWDWGLGYSR